MAKVDGPVVAVHLLSGTKYYCVNDSEPKSNYVRTSTTKPRANGWKKVLRLHVNILRPDLVETTVPKKRVRIGVQRQDIDLLIKGHISTKAFLDYEGFLDDLMKAIT